MAGCQEMAERLRESYPAYLGINATDEAGVIRCATMPVALGLSIGDRLHVRRARETGGFAVGEFIVRRDTQKPALSFALPYRDRAGVPAGFVTALLDLGWLEDYLARKPLPAGAAITLADRHGVVLARMPEVPGAVGKRLPERYLPLLERAERGSVEMVGLDGALRVQGYMPLAVGTSGLFIMAGLDKAAALAPIHGTLWRSLGVLGVTALLALAAGLLGRAPLHPRSRAGSGGRDRALARRRLRGPGEPSGRWLGTGRARTRLRRHGRKPGNPRSGTRGGPRGDTQGCRGVRLHDRQRVRGRSRLAHHLHERARPEEVAQGQDQVGLNLWEAYPEGVNTRMWSAYHRAMAERVPIEVEDYYPPHRRWYRFRAFPSREGLAFYGQDVTAQRRLQEDLERQRALLETIIESTPDPDLRQGPRGTLHHAELGRRPRPSDATRPRRRSGSQIPKMFPPETAAALRDQDLRIMETGETEVAEEMIPDRHRGETRVFLTTKTPLRDSAGAVIGIIGVARDITERKAAEEALRHAKEEAERANLAKSKFLAAASHDLRQPLQSLILFAGVLKGYVQGPRGEQALKQLEHGLGALKALLDSLLDVSQLDAGIVKPEITDFPISAVLDEIAASYAPIAAAKGLGWQVESCTDGVRSDMTLLGRVLRNLVENAVRYTKSGHIRIICRRIEDRLRIEVEDTGIGIPPEQLDRIFDEFHQVGNQARDRTQGLGLGLAIVRRIADLLGHRIETRSRPGEGSTFSIELPLAMTEAVRLPVSGDAGSDQNGQGRLVVVIDDDAMVLESLEAILTEWGYQAIAAVSAEEAIAQVQELGRRPDIVIADYRLQDGRTGTEAILAVRALFDHPIPGLILTGETDPKFLRECTGHDVGIAHKPVMPSQLGRALDQQLNAAA